MTSRILEIVEQELSGPLVDSRVLPELMARIRERVEAEVSGLDLLLEELCCEVGTARFLKERHRDADPEPWTAYYHGQYRARKDTTIRLAEAMDETLDEKGE